MILAALLAAASPGFAALGPLIGHCWRGTLPDGGVDTHCFAWAKDGAGARDRHVVRKGSRAVYRGETAYVVEGTRLRWAYRDEDGPVMAGAVTAMPGGLRFAVNGGSPLIWRWRGRRAYAADIHAGAAPVLFRRLD